MPSQSQSQSQQQQQQPRSSNELFNYGFLTPLREPRGGSSLTVALEAHPCTIWHDAEHFALLNASEAFIECQLDLPLLRALECVVSEIHFSHQDPSVAVPIQLRHGDLRGQVAPVVELLLLREPLEGDAAVVRGN
eukprot:CAMPEP_0194749940 /NCGR_PEP_ID=MMETSP0323_2-20130528/3990_1 /TAXON_ID=2866 ORGANISM="Crypthecodinium cohnii, Strain Seligo" /NCGR_SAMPLE_ID=MMETSP0323_2 /ASSEMBLY_ACC=CAM_ASM_000346 /LENGTH=134 /DNA_ID=CAMNT_0039665259 /DNA_START=240 /DNA_END=643 /DNA_ORIENTATION=+